MYHIDASAQTDIGNKRERNEDSVLVLPELGLYCVADGMGGVRCGDRASQEAVGAVAGLASAAADTARSLTTTVLETLQDVNTHIRELASDLGAEGMGATVVLLLIDRGDGESATIIHAGDSRAYLLRDGTLERLTDDHTVAAACGLGDKDSIPSIIRGKVTRALGLDPNVELEVRKVNIVAGDEFLLCSDGLNIHLDDDDIAAILERHSGDGAKDAATALIEETKARGADDNVSAVVVRINERSD